MVDFRTRAADHWPQEAFGMDKLFIQNELNPTTWVYLSSLITIAVYFKFSRLWSVRNLDLVALVAMGPGLLLTTSGADFAYVGYVWLFAGCEFFLVRMLTDPMMVRRPLLEPNLSVGGHLFMTFALLLFLITTVITSDLTDADLEGAKQLDNLIQRQEVAKEDTGLRDHGPGYPLLHLLASVPSKALIQVGDEAPAAQAQLIVHAATARTTAILSHLAVVAGMLLIGHLHFGRVSTGIAAAGLYLLLPYTAQNVGRVDHALPAALLVWSVMAYRRPTISGMLLGLATGAVYYPVFLFPLWASFYWHKGLVRMASGFAVVLALLTASLALTSSSLEMFTVQVQQMYGLGHWFGGPVSGFWEYNAPVYRIPVLTAFIAMSLGLVLWPAQKNLGTLLSCSAAVMLGTQFWHAEGGGTYFAWFLPLLLLTVFRPNLEDRVAVSVLGEAWFSKRRQPSSAVEQAA